MTAADVKTSEGLRKAWLDFFAARGHTVVPSAGLIPHHPTAPMFTNSGMMQFVPYFLGEEPVPFVPPRATSIQKCVRLAGKHNDIDELGRTRRHLTFFEMLGNWSFGEYFKAEAIAWAWEFLTEVSGFDGDRIWVTVHDTDDEAEAIWHEAIHVPMDRIQRMGKENFWEMGETGPCGPSSEIHYDCGPEWGDDGGPKFGGGDRFVEFWNLVFMTDFRRSDDTLTELPAKNVDTGAGFERWLMLLQGGRTALDIDIMQPLLDAAQSGTGRTYGRDAETDVALRILADHTRSTTFLVNDGVIPSNEDRGYVLRRVIRRAVRFAYLLGVNQPVLPAIVEACIDTMAGAYPDLSANHDLIMGIVTREEESFRSTLARGVVLLDTALEGGAQQVPGDIAFKLHDTYGFPFEVTQEIAEERGVTVDRDGFEVLMTEQRQRAKGAAKKGDLYAHLNDFQSVLEHSGATEFVGREEFETKATVVAVIPDDESGTVSVFLDRSPFYAESGGQVGDTGTISTDTGAVEVLDTVYGLPGLHRHVARVVDGEVSPGQEATAAIDVERRDAIRRNHTGTHILHWALREVLGDHVKQQGSHVAPDRLRFDFSHYEPVNPEQVAAIEDLANHEILGNAAVHHYETTKSVAEGMGAIAFFGDKYGDVVRVLEAGTHSLELCGGTHVRALGDIGPVKVVREESIGSNLRRIEAVTGTGPIDRLRQMEAQRVEDEQEYSHETKALRDEIKDLRRQVAMGQADGLLRDADGRVLITEVKGVDRDALRDMAVHLRDRPELDAVVLATAPPGGGAAVVAATTKDSGFNAGDLIREAAKAIKGGGGKGDDLAMAGGKDAEGIGEAIRLARAAAGIE